MFFYIFKNKNKKKEPTPGYKNGFKKRPRDAGNPIDKTTSLPLSRVSACRIPPQTHFHPTCFHTPLPFPPMSAELSAKQLHRKIVQGHDPWKVFLQGLFGGVDLSLLMERFKHDLECARLDAHGPDKTRARQRMRLLEQALALQEHILGDLYRRKWAHGLRWFMQNRSAPLPDAMHPDVKSLVEFHRTLSDSDTNYTLMLVTKWCRPDAACPADAACPPSPKKRKRE